MGPVQNPRRVLKLRDCTDATKDTKDTKDTMTRRRLLAATLLAMAPFGVPAQAPWPSKPVKLVVPTGPGSSLDLIARSMSDKLGARWGQPVVVENKPGAGGMLGLDLTAKASDGHTLAIGFNGPIAFAPFLYRKMPYDPAKDLLPVIMTTSQPNVLAVSVDKVPAKTVAEFVAWAKAQNGKLNYSSLGNGSSAHLTMELFMAEAGFSATHVPFNGSPPAAMAVAQGEVDATFMVAPALLPHVRNNKVVTVSAEPNAMRAYLARVSPAVLGPPRKGKAPRLSAYAFRHALVTDLRDTGWTTEEIAAVIGELSAATVAYYGLHRRGKGKVRPGVAIEHGRVATANPVKPLDRSGLQAVIEKKARSSSRLKPR